MTFALRRQLQLARHLGWRLKHNEDGTTAIEFGLIALPFFMLLIGVLSVCHLYFWIFTAENAVWTASRDMRTGTFQTGGSVYAGLTGTPLINAFKQQICNQTVNATDCYNHSTVLVQSTASATTGFTGLGLTQPNCKNSTNGLLAQTDPTAVFNPGAASATVIVTLCYAWGFGGKLPFLKLGQLSDGSFLIEASAVFRTEPYQ